MKKVLILLLIASAVFACSGGAKNNKETTPEKEEDITKNPDYQKGVELASKSDCLTCHKIEEKNIGPAWRDVADKYAAKSDAVEYLAQKIINGGNGVWGEIPMAAHSSMSMDDARALAKYVLLLKRK